MVNFRGQTHLSLYDLRSMAPDVTYRAPTTCHSALAGRRPQERMMITKNVAKSCKFAAGSTHLAIQRIIQPTGNLGDATVNWGTGPCDNAKHLRVVGGEGRKPQPEEIFRSFQMHMALPKMLAVIKLGIPFHSQQ